MKKSTLVLGAAALLTGLAWALWPATPADAAAPVTFGERVNGGLDELMALGDRLLELPLVVALALFAAVAGLGLVAITRLAGARPARLVAWLAAATALAGAAFLADRRFALQQQQLDALRQQLRTAPAVHGPAPLAIEATLQAPAPTEAPAAPVAAAEPPQNPPTRAPLPAAAPAKPAAAPAPARTAAPDPAAAVRSLAARFQGATWRELDRTPAVVTGQMHSDEPLFEAFVALVDLQRPGVQVVIGGGLDHKTMTSDFGNGNACTVAVNGEAGESPAENARLGQWRGNLVQQGEVVLREDPAIPRPFLAFDAAQNATFVAAAAVARDLQPRWRNVIWGRLDSIVDGTVLTADERNRQPRTAMGVDASGHRLVLLVVDGRQPRYSMGATRAEVGYLLEAFGARHGMLCDEGGSSCMYVRARGGVVDSPSDMRGVERPTYTHFGVVETR